MKIGVPKEIKILEYRVGMPSSVAELVHRGHQVLVETNAGIGIGIIKIIKMLERLFCPPQKKFLILQN